MNYLISYDLNKSDKNYDGLIHAIKTISIKCCSPCKSTWIIKTNILNSKSVYEYVSKEIDSNDHLIVVAITTDVFGQLSNETADYLNSFIYAL